MEDQSDSEKEILQWEMEKLKHGMSAKCIFIYYNYIGSIKNNTQQPKKEKQHKNLNEIFTKINTNIDIDAIINRISEDVSSQEVYKYINYRYKQREQKIDLIHIK